MTLGSFQAGSNRKASSLVIGVTRKSLNRCHWSVAVGSGDDVATIMHQWTSAHSKLGTQLTIDHGDQMRLLILTTVDIGNHSHELINLHVVSVSCLMKLHILTFITIKLAVVVDYHANLLRQPIRRRPQLFRLRILDIGIDHQYRGTVQYGPPLSHRAISPTRGRVTPTSGRLFSLHACFEDVGEFLKWCSALRGPSNMLRWVHELMGVDIIVSSLFMSAIYTSNRCLYSCPQGTLHLLIVRRR